MTAAEFKDVLEKAVVMIRENQAAVRPEVLDKVEELLNLLSSPGRMLFTNADVFPAIHADAFSAIRAAVAFERSLLPLTDQLAYAIQRLLEHSLELALVARLMR